MAAFRLSNANVASIALSTRWFRFLLTNLGQRSLEKSVHRFLVLVDSPTKEIARRNDNA